MLYGVAVGDLGIAPSEVRNMTAGEIYAVIDAKTRHTKKEIDDKAELYEWLQELKANERNS